MVAIGLLTQLVLERHADEARTVAQFFVKVGLPVHFGQLTLSLSDTAQMSEVMEAAMTTPIMANEPFAVTKNSLLAAASQVNELGIEVARSDGDAAYRTLHGH